MAHQTVGVYSGKPEVIQHLRKRCADFSFLEGEEADRCRVVVVDADHAAALEAQPRKSVARIVLNDGSLTQPRRHGDLRVERESFLAAPGDALAAAVDLAETVIHATTLEQEVGYLTQIHELMAMIEPEAVSERVTRTVLNLLGVAKGALLLHDPRLERYVASFSNDPSSRDTGEFLPGIPADVLQRALASGDYIAVDRQSGLAIMPLRADDDLIGVIRVSITPSDEIDEAAAAAVTRYLKAVSQVLGNVYQLTRSRDLAMRDDLTKAFNRRFFESYLDEEMERARRYGSLFSIIFLDLDDLKMVNNFYGHLSGSRTLQEVAKRILNAVRGIDKVVRFGGDEFCIILPQTDQDQAVAVANRVRKAFVSAPFMLEQTIEISITASFGIATYPVHAVTKEDLIRQADLAMMRVKASTKNAVGVATVEDATRPVVR